MNTRIKLLSALLMLCFITACDKKNDDLVKPLTASEFPQVINFDDEGDGDLEDEDKFSFVLTLNDRVDPTGADPAGVIVPLTQNVTVSFEVDDFEGFAKISDYIKGVSAFYEIDDCTTNPVTVQFNATTGKGTVVFPAGVEEVEIEFDTDDALFDDNTINTNDREISFKITAVSGASNVTFNKAGEFTYQVLDDDAIHGEWELDHTNPAAFTAFKNLFGLINDDVKNLTAAQVDKIVISIEYDEVNIEIELKATETVTECGVTSVENKVIEIEAGLEELSTGTATGDIEFAEEIEQSNGSLEEFVYKGSFIITGNTLALKLKGEYDGNETNQITLTLTK